MEMNDMILRHSGNEELHGDNETSIIIHVTGKFFCYSIGDIITDFKAAEDSKSVKCTIFPCL
jgi:hypothetical protein